MKDENSTYTDNSKNLNQNLINSNGNIYDLEYIAYKNNYKYNVYKECHYFRLFFYIFSPLLIIFVYLLFPLFPKKNNEGLICISNISYNYWYRPFYLIVNHLLYTY